MICISRIFSLKKKTPDFANSTLLKLFGTSLLTMVVGYIAIIINCVIVGNIVGEDALCAVNLVIPLYEYAIFISGLICIGSSLIYYRYLGRYDNDRANEIFGQSLILCAAASVLMFLFMQFGENFYISTLNVSDAIRFEIEEFWKYEKYVIAITPISYLLAQMLYTDIILNIISNLVAVIGGIALSVVFTLRYGTFGASLGTFIGILISILIFCIHFFEKKNIIHFKWHLSLNDIKEAFRLSIVDASKYLDVGLLRTFINRFVILNFSESLLPIASVALTVFDMAVIFDSIGAAIAPVAEVYFGEENTFEEIYIAKYAMKLAVKFGLIIAALLVIFAPYIPLLYGVKAAEEVRISATVIRIIAISMPAFAITYMLISQYVLVRKILLATIYEWVKSFFMPIAFIFLFGNLFGFYGIWAAFPVALPVTILVFAIAVRLRYGKDKGIWLVDPDKYISFGKTYYVSEDTALSARGDVELFLSANGVSRDCIHKIMMIVEESSLLLLSKSQGRKVLVQYIVSIRDGSVFLYERDNGPIYNLTDADAKVDSLRQYVYNCIIDSYSRVQYLTTTDYNRNVFRVE